MISHKFHERLQVNVQDVVELMSIGLADDVQGRTTDIKLRQECMKCYQVSFLDDLLFE